MALNIVQKENTGSYDPYVKFNGKAGRWYIKNEAGEEIEVTPTSFVADLENIKTGWMMFAAGLAPDKVYDTNLSTPAERPTPNHKRGFSLRLFSKSTFNGVVELSGSSMHICNSINDLYEAFEKSKEPGKVPVVKFTGTSAMKDKQGTNYKPNFSIEKWIDRPAELDAVSAPAQSTPQASAPAASSVSEF